jgi:mannose-6-phosphate isomerase-like protein (cupin superfamily)/DNA-binding XRE family transcriptional regulator
MATKTKVTVDKAAKKLSKAIGNRLAGLRDACGYTPEQLAGELGIELALYQRYEAVGEDIPISVLFQIANKFGVDFNEILTGDAGKLDSYQVVRAGRGKSINRFDGYDYQDLAFRYTQKIMQPLLVTLQPDDKEPALVTHVGQEFNYVIEGTMILMVGDHQLTLEVGDCVYLNPMIPHSQRCGGKTQAAFVTVIAE